MTRPQVCFWCCKLCVFQRGVCVLICVLHVSVQILQPSLRFKHSLGCHYGLITMSVWLMAGGRPLIALSLNYSTYATTLPMCLSSLAMSSSITRHKVQYVKVIRSISMLSPSCGRHQSVHLMLMMTERLEIKEETIWSLKPLLALQGNNSYSVVFFRFVFLSFQHFFNKTLFWKSM